MTQSKTMRQLNELFRDYIDPDGHYGIITVPLSKLPMIGDAMRYTPMENYPYYRITDPGILFYCRQILTLPSDYQVRALVGTDRAYVLTITPGDPKETARRVVGTNYEIAINIEHEQEPWFEILVEALEIPVIGTRDRLDPLILPRYRFCEAPFPKPRMELDRECCYYALPTILEGKRS